MRKNEILYSFIYEKLSSGKGISGPKLHEMAKEELESNYDCEQFRNLLYNLTYKKALAKDDDKLYYLAGDHWKAFSEIETKEKETNDIINDYIAQIRKICIQTKNDLRDPFSKFQDEKQLNEAAKLYRVNEELLAFLKKINIR